MKTDPNKHLHVVQAYEGPEKRPEPERPRCIPEKAQWFSGKRQGVWRGFWYWLDDPRHGEVKERNGWIAKLGLPFWTDVEARRAVGMN